MAGEFLHVASRGRVIQCLFAVFVMNQTGAREHRCPCPVIVCSEIDKNIDYMTSLRKDKRAVEGKLRK